MLISANASVWNRIPHALSSPHRYRLFRGGDGGGQPQGPARVHIRRWGRAVRSAAAVRSAQILDATGAGPLAGRDSCRGRAHPGGHRPRLFLSAALFRGPWSGPDWDAFLVDFQKHWPTHEPNTYVDFVRDGICGNGAARTGDRRWRRLCEERTKGAKSVFHFDVTGQVAKSTHGGLPWLLFLRRRLVGRLHFWPFDGWEVPPGRSVVAEVYPSLWKHAFPRGDRDSHQHDAYCVAAWMSRADREGRLAELFSPSLTPAVRTQAEVEGWIFGIA